APAPQPDRAEIRGWIMDGQTARALEALKAQPQDSPWVRYLTGLAYYHRDDHVRAIELLAPVIAELPDGSPERREAVQVLGLSYFVAGRLQEALPLLEETREWASDTMELARVLGAAYIQTRQPAKAREAIARVFGVASD